MFMTVFVAAIERSATICYHRLTIRHSRRNYCKDHRFHVDGLHGRSDRLEIGGWVNPIPRYDYDESEPPVGLDVTLAFCAFTWKPKWQPGDVEALDGEIIHDRAARTWFTGIITSCSRRFRR
jgi:hypothetical protein